MSTQDELLAKLKQTVTEQSARKDFVHNAWFVKYHLEIVDKIAQELCQVYPDANTFRVLVLAWVHDYEKIIDFDDEHNTELAATKSLLQQTGFDDAFVDQICTDVNTLNAKENLQAADIEVQIVSSADAASHLVGPFGSLYWYENPDTPMEDVQTERFRKLSVDWEKKVTLPEVKQAFEARNTFGREATGELPDTYLK